MGDPANVERLRDESASARAKNIYVFANEKGVAISPEDKETINRIILEMSASSKYTQRQLKNDAKVDAKVEAMRRKLAAAEPHVRRSVVAQVESRICELEQCRRLDRICAVVDFGEAIGALHPVCCPTRHARGSCAHVSTIVVLPSPTDMFYAAVEIRDRPELADKPVAVGGIGMISTANYVARAWGVRSAMPGFVGQALCRRGPEFHMPKAELVFVPPNFAKYAAVAEVARAIFREYDGGMSSYSLDEAYLDLTAYVGQRARLGSHEAVLAAAAARANTASHGAVPHGEQGREGEEERAAGEEAAAAVSDDDADSRSASPVSRGALLRVAEEAVAELRGRVKEATGGLTCSAGIGPTFQLAKVCADQRKPDGQFALGSSSDEVRSFLRELPTRKVGGIGRVLEKQLRCALGVGSCGELLEACRRGDVHLAFSPVSADSLLCAALGASDSRHAATAATAEPSGGRAMPSQKGISVERTFAATADRAALLGRLQALCQRLAEEMAACCEGKGVRGRTVSLKLKTDAFDVATRDSTGQPAHTAEQLWARVRPLFLREADKADEQGCPLRIRLLGVRCSKLQRADADKLAVDGQPSIAAFLTHAPKAAAAAAAAGAGGVLLGDGAAGSEAHGVGQREEQTEETHGLTAAHDDEDEDDGDDDDEWEEEQQGEEEGAQPLTLLAPPNGRAPAACTAAGGELALHGPQQPAGQGMAAGRSEPARAAGHSPVARPAARGGGSCGGSRPAKYARLSWSEVDQSVLTELPEHIRAQLGEEMQAPRAARPQCAGPVAVARIDAGRHGSGGAAAARPRLPAKGTGCSAGGRGGGIEQFLTHVVGTACTAAGKRRAAPEAGGLATDERLEAIVAMGFAEAEAAVALEKARGNTQAAVERLLAQQL